MHMIQVSASSWDGRGLQRDMAVLIIEASVKKKLEMFPKVTFRDPKKLYDLHDLCEVQSLKENPLYKKRDTDTSAETNPVISELPPSV